jgi:hypothetical protein
MYIYNLALAGVGYYVHITYVRIMYILCTYYICTYYVHMYVCGAFPAFKPFGTLFQSTKYLLSNRTSLHRRSLFDNCTYTEIVIFQI